ncbi:MAG: TIGR01212 family radical SAM protein [Clostridia bacterium]|nr:TIGR01212 family radical SAM protein [Clostridia bacterium]
MEKIRYKHLNTHLKDMFGERTLKICIDGGFTCPNRDGKISFGGCLFCGEMGAGENIKYRTDKVLESIQSQVLGFLNSYRGERANKFIAYFQSFSNTYGDIDSLKKKYDTALACSEKIVGLQVSTRPDCIDEDVVKLLASYKGKYYVCVELGLQTSNDKIGKFLNRGYTKADFEKATTLLHRYGIDVVSHLMIGLPNETEQDVLETVGLINRLKCEGIKIHSTYVIAGSGLGEMYKTGKYTPITQEYYVDMVAKVISRLDKDIVIHRINADPPKCLFLAPDWILHKKLVLNAINRKLDEDDIIQGQYCNAS